MARVAVDAMGGDLAPSATVLGAISAARAAGNGALQAVLVGREDEIRAQLRAHPGDATLPENVRIVHAADVLEMHEAPVEALRRKPDTSIQRAMELLAAGEVDAVVSAGHTGGVVAAATLHVGRLPGARRAGIAAPFPTRGGHCVVMDVGANLHPKAGDLVQYAVMATEYATAVLGVESPRVGVLSIGDEEGKGSPLVLRTAEALRGLDDIEFIGNVEGQSIFDGGADVILCEGFVGNVILKASEGLLEAFVLNLLGQLERRVAGSEEPSGTAVGEIMGELRRRTDYTRYGGAPLMGFDGALFICHGRSPETAVKNAVEAAASYVDAGVNERIARGLAALAENAPLAAILGGNG